MLPEAGYHLDKEGSPEAIGSAIQYFQALMCKHTAVCNGIRGALTVTNVQGLEWHPAELALLRILHGRSAQKVSRPPNTQRDIKEHSNVLKHVRIEQKSKLTGYWDDY